MEVRMKHSEGKLGNQKNILELYLQIWEPQSSKSTRAVIALVHGLGEHGGRYGGDFAEFYTKAGFAIMAPDLPGHGRTPGKRGHISDTSLFLDYIDALIADAEKRYPGKPVFLYGHSMGGQLAIWYALARKPKIAGVIVTSPSISTHDPAPAVKRLMAKLMNNILPGFTMNNGLDAKLLSHDANVVQAYVNDPLVHPMVSARLGLMILNQGQWSLAHASENQNRMLVMIGSEEGIVSKTAVDKFCKKAPNVTYKIWPGLFHEIHNEAEKQEVFAFTLKWMEGWLKK
jgi:acylglycerol lipase